MNPRIRVQYGSISREMANREYRLLNDYYFKSIRPGDTAVCQLTRPAGGKEPGWYYLTGLVLSKDSADRMIDVKLISFQSDLPAQNVKWMDHTYSIGDTIHGDSQTWRMTKRYDYSWNYYYPSHRQLK